MQVNISINASSTPFDSAVPPFTEVMPPPAHITITTIANQSSDGNSFQDATPSNTSAHGFFEQMRMVKITLLAVIFVCILCGNIFVLLALNNRKLKINRMYFFLVHLSIADLITGFFNVLPQLAWEAARRFYGGNILCKLVKFLQILGPYLSSYVLVMTSIDRYQAICHPLANSSTQSTSRSRWMVALAWAISLLSCTPQLVIFSYQKINQDVYECWATFPEPWTTKLYVTWYTVSVFIVPFVILTYTHILICHEIWLNWHSKRQSLMIKEKHTKQQKGGLPAMGSQYHQHVTSGLCPSTLHPSNLLQPHSPLPDSKLSSKFSLASPSHFALSSSEEKLPADNTNVDPNVITSQQISSKCSSKLNRFLWICHKSSSVTSNSSGSSNASCDSSTCSPHHHHHHHHHQPQQQQHTVGHHHSTPVLAHFCPKLELAVCQHHNNDSDSQHFNTTSNKMFDQTNPTNGIHHKRCLSFSSSSNSPYIKLPKAAPYSDNSSKDLVKPDNEQSQQAKCVPSHQINAESSVDSETLLRNARSESELWYERQRRQIKKKCKRLQLLECQAESSRRHYLASWSSLPTSSSSSSSSISSADSKDGSWFVSSSSVQDSKNRFHNMRHRRYTIGVLSHENDLTLEHDQLDNDQESNNDSFSQCKPEQVVGRLVANGVSAKQSISKRIYLHHDNCSCVNCRLRCRCSSIDRRRGRNCSTRKLQKLSNSKPIWKVIKQKGPTVKQEDQHQPPDTADQKSLLISNLTARSTEQQKRDQQTLVGSGSEVNYSPTRPTHLRASTVTQLVNNETESGDERRASWAQLSLTTNPTTSLDCDSGGGGGGGVGGSKLAHSTSTSISAGAGSGNVLVPRNYHINRTRATRLSNPRIHSMQGLTRAKIKTVKITLVVITCYVLCSSPFICVQLWAQWWPGAQETSIWSGPIIAILMLLPSLNSCVNPWIYIYFNPNLVSSFCSLFSRKSSSNSNLHSVGGKNSNGGNENCQNRSRRTVGGTICGHTTLHKMLTNDSGEGSNSMDSRSIQNNSRFDLISAAAKETQTSGGSSINHQFGGSQPSHRRSLSSMRIGHMRSCGTATDISVVTSLDDNPSTVTTATTATVTPTATLVINQHSNSNTHKPQHPVGKLLQSVDVRHINLHPMDSSNQSSLSNLDSGIEHNLTYESTITLDKSSNTKINSDRCNISKYSEPECSSKCSFDHQTPNGIGSKTTTHVSNNSEKERKSRHISINWDKMWNKLTVSSGRLGHSNNTTSQVHLYTNSKQTGRILTTNEQFTV